jgi:acyl-coenzyme A thioesterase PaaI-like protein
MDEIPLDREMFGREQPCFGCSPTHPIGFHLEFAQRGDQVVTRFTPGEQYQGPPGLMHGGLVTTLADELAAWAIIASRGQFGFTVEIKARLHKPVRIGVEIEGCGSIKNDNARIVKTLVELKQEGALCYRGEFTFALLGEAAAEQLLGRPLPEAWKKFARTR